MKSPFEINAFTATLAHTKKDNNLHILNNGSWQIPIYQRPYSWGENEIRRFLRDLFENFRDEAGERNPMFIGTMQISEIKEGKRDVIDGQQRLTTFLLIFRALNLRNENQEDLIPTCWLTSKVNKGEAQSAMEFVLSKDIGELNAELQVNKYAENLKLIHDFFEENLSKEDLEEFKNYILENVYFVCIETKANLSKTLQIFEAINATGMDLNAGDLFKVNFYEYLTTKHNAEESMFESISELYAKIDIANKENGEVFTSIMDILALYKMILISKYDLQNSLYFMGTETFYEQLFDKLLNNVSNEGFGLKAHDVILSITDIDRLINLRVDWHSSLGATLEEDMSYYFIIWSRYNRYWRTILTFEYVYERAISKELLGSYKIQFAKLLLIYSVKFGKAVNECHNFVRAILKSMFVESDPQRIIDMINVEINRHKSSDFKIGTFEQNINQPIAGIPKTKYLLCRLGAMLHENYKTDHADEITALRQILAFDEIDIEHIQSFNHEDLAMRLSLWDDWKDEIHSLGNLVILERSVNRQISNSVYGKKQVAYGKSCYTAVREIGENHLTWTLLDAENRREAETNLILDYIFNNA
ncbi:DUF262 domain-containing protein [Nonlabens antarcticus]|uniref:DUF262 domain-containing protein n=1 Tax=Nonlabens antarcticus TaxID=392714 RepID=UPI001891C0E5|nr:DUF262 domain-containing protein [Nonlabens antarcticus]